MARSLCVAVALALSGCDALLGLDDFEGGRDGGTTTSEGGGGGASSAASAAGGAGEGGSATVGGGGGASLGCGLEGTGGVTFQVDPSGSCYFFRSGGVAWPTARALCQGLGMGWDLVVIDQAEWPSLKAAPALVDNGPWIGLSDDPTLIADATEGNFRWVDDAAATWADWFGREPNNGADGDGPENCVALFSNAPHQWNDFPCDDAEYYRDTLCEGPTSP